MANPTIREARVEDVPDMVELSEQFRSQLESFQPHFWHKAADSREKHLPFITSQVERDDVISLVHERDGIIEAFIIAFFTFPPPVYDAGKTCVVDDFCVASNEDWASVGRLLLEEIQERARQREATQIVVICPQQHQPKRSLLQEMGLSVTAENHVVTL